MTSTILRYGLPLASALIVSGLIAWAGWAPLPEQQLVNFESPEPIGDVNQTDSFLPDLDEFATVWNKRLYSPRIEEPPAVVPVDDDAQNVPVVPERPPPEPSLTLVQVLFSEQARLAVFEENGSRKRVRLVENQVYDGLKVIRILPETVTGEFAGRIVELSLQSETAINEVRE